MVEDGLYDENGYLVAENHDEILNKIKDAQALDVGVIMFIILIKEGGLKRRPSVSFLWDFKI